MIQLHSILSNFKKPFAQRYGLTPVTDWNKPVVFFGMYKKQWDVLAKLNAPGVIVWSGTDGLHLLNNPERFKRIAESKNLIHITPSKFLDEDLEWAGIPHELIPVPVKPYEDIKPKPNNGTYAYTYKGNKKRENDTYNFEKVEEICAEEDIALRHAYHSDMSRQELLKVYEGVRFGIRATGHDGMSNTVCELGMMGRMVFHNGDQPNAIPYSDFNELQRRLKEAYSNPPNPVMIHELMKDYLQQGEAKFKAILNERSC